MSWTGLRAFYGLERPFNFAVALPFLLNACVLAVVLLVCAVMFLSGNLTLGTMRFYFFLYIVALLLAAIAISRFPIVSCILLSWCALELGLALTTSEFGNYLSEMSLLPVNYYTPPSEIGFSYHPLLQGVPKPNWQQVRHFYDRELIFHHNSYGIRGVELTRNDFTKDIIFVYGGSTTYDVGVTQGKTWVERLQAEMNGRYTVLNFGVPGYSTSEHLIQTAFYESIGGKRPVCAVYYVGWNDIRSAHIEKLDRAYADFHLSTQIDALLVRKPAIWGASYSPVALLLTEAARRRFDTLPQMADIDGRPRPRGNQKPLTGSDRQLESIFTEHIDAIMSINGSRHVKTVFIGQILNRAQLVSDGVYGFLPFVRDKDVWSLQEHFNQVMQSSAVSSGAKYIDAGVGNFENADFVDNGHFSAAGAEKFAKIIAPKVEDYCH